ncbi:nuclear transport factor 2 family protein [Fangia hongkongensis]|uniref:nuclear transport factor 2 family protein n=1 Tax=Fangia hongkongensis TaxID=270495 RepID=UPI00036FFD33|nr:nuclear transport factor 2 family protein [Fangia hongkongensis]MBK2125645.1 nuclear transport factor 2 family protein [Fangia hongkongensis]
MLKEKLKYLFESAYLPETDVDKLIHDCVDKSYQQYVDGHTLNFAGFLEHVKKQRELVKSVRFEFKYLVEEGDMVASLHQVSALKNDGSEILAEVHAFFSFKNGLLIGCDERTRILQGEKTDEALAHIR